MIQCQIRFINQGPATSAAIFTTSLRLLAYAISKTEEGVFYVIRYQDQGAKLWSFPQQYGDAKHRRVYRVGYHYRIIHPDRVVTKRDAGEISRPDDHLPVPLLIGYTGGKLIGGERGGVVGAITTMGVIVGADMPMFLGAMIAGPLGGWAIKHFDSWVDGKIKSGFEMLVNNFSAGIIGMILAILAFLGIGPAVEVLSKILAAGVNFMVVHDMLPLASIFVEPAKILFLNNAINHGIFSPLGIQQSHELGKSIFFLIEANPGPGMGVLLAYMFFGRGNAKQSAGGAAIIHFLGGIHEIYFPYVLMNPRLILAVILGGMTGVFTLTILNGGLVSPASPGSILAVLAMTPKGAYFANIAAIIAAMAVSFVVSAILLKTSKVKEEDDIDAATRRMQDMKAESKGAATRCLQVPWLTI
jgi:PTS system mannitol-specific IIC component